MEKNRSCFQFWTILQSAFDNMPQGCATEEIFVEALLSREHYDRANTRPGELNPKHAFLGGNSAPNSSKPRNVDSDPHKCPGIIQIPPRVISGADVQ
jgi:hypothetical protein